MATIPQRTLKPQVSARPSVTTTRVSVVVVNFRQWRNTTRLTRSLADSELINADQAEIIIVDNDSPPDPILPRLRRLPGVKLKQFGRNTGFSKAVNEGCRMASGDWILLLNPDTAVTEGFLDQVEFFCRSIEDEYPKVGVVGMSLCHSDGSPQASCGPEPTLSRSLGGLFLKRRVRRCRPISAPDRVAVPWVTGCGMLVRRECWAALGGFDESFFLYYEDADFCRRAWAGGWTVWFEPSLQVTHYNPLHVRSVPPELRLMTRHALLTYAHKHWGGWRSRSISAVVWLEALGRQIKSAVLGRRSAYHRELRKLAADWFRDRPTAARYRVQQTAPRLADCEGREDGDA